MKLKIHYFIVISKILCDNSYALVSEAKVQQKIDQAVEQRARELSDSQQQKIDQAIEKRTKELNDLQQSVFADHSSSFYAELDYSRSTARAIKLQLAQAQQIQRNMVSNIQKMQQDVLHNTCEQLAVLDFNNTKNRTINNKNKLNYQKLEQYSQKLKQRTEDVTTNAYSLIDHRKSQARELGKRCDMLTPQWRIGYFSESPKDDYITEQILTH